MANEDEFIVFGIFLAFAAIFLIISPAADNLVMLFTGLKMEKIQLLSVISLFGGISMAIVAGRSRK